NNQLAHPGIEKMLADRGILYAPDYVVNAGGVVQVADELAGFNLERAKARAAGAFATTRKILAPADPGGGPPAGAADPRAGRGTGWGGGGGAGGGGGRAGGGGNGVGGPAGGHLAGPVAVPGEPPIAARPGPRPCAKPLRVRPPRQGSARVANQVRL